MPLATLWAVNVTAYLVHEVTFYFLLCYRPFGIQFHVETSLFSVYFAKLERGTLKPVRWGVSDEHLDQVKSFGVKKFEDFTWKHMLDFYSCADCGRCADNCPANAAGRPLAPRFLTHQGQRLCVSRTIPCSASTKEATPLIGNMYSEDEIWSCTTCGACEEECPLLVEYIDKIVDLRRGMIDDGNVPQSLQKPLKALESRGNPYGKMEKKKADWIKAPEFRKGCEVKVLDGKNSADTVYFVDSITSYDDRMQSIGRSTARILDHIGVDFGILGAAEKDSGHEVRRFGEETLFMALRDHNTDAIKVTGVKRIVTADPHAYNALRHDYKDVPPVEHISQVIAREVKAGNIQFNPVENARQRVCLPRPLLSGAPQPGLRRSSHCAGCDSWIEESGDEAVARPVVLLRRWRADVVLRAQRRAADGCAAGSHGGRCGGERDRDGLPILHGEYRRCHQGRGTGRQDVRH